MKQITLSTSQLEEVLNILSNEIAKYEFEKSKGSIFAQTMIDRLTELKNTLKNRRTYAGKFL